MITMKKAWPSRTPEALKASHLLRMMDPDYASSQKMKCPKCNEVLNIGQMLGSMKSDAKTKAARENAKKGGWKKGKKRKPKL